MKTITIIVDSRERTPLIFPSTLTVLDRTNFKAPYNAPSTQIVRVVTQRLQIPEADYKVAEGDGGWIEYSDKYTTYALQNVSSVMVERKCGLAELAKNLLSNDRPRFLDAISRFHDKCAHPIVLFEGNPVAQKPIDVAGVRFHPGVVADALADILAKFPRLRYLWLNPTSTEQRTIVGEWAARLMLSLEGSCRTTPAVPTIPSL